jgi:hypothetical protein
MTTCGQDYSGFLAQGITFRVAAVDGTEPAADSRGFRFADSAGKEIWLADIP